MPYKDPTLPAAIASRRAAQKRHYLKNREQILADPERRKRVAANSKAYHQKNKAKRTAAARKLRGLPLPSRPEPQACEICGGPPVNRDTCLHLDHNHANGAFRGWLCGHCNRAIGLLKDSSDLCIAAARYLRVAELL